MSGVYSSTQYALLFIKMETYLEFQVETRVYVFLQYRLRFAFVSSFMMKCRLYSDIDMVYTRVSILARCC